MIKWSAEEMSHTRFTLEIYTPHKQKIDYNLANKATLIMMIALTIDLAFSVEIFMTYYSLHINHERTMNSN